MSRTTNRECGFTLIELLVALVLVSLVLGGAFAMFNYTNKLTRTQLHQSDLQQSARVAQRELMRTVRMAGRGGLPGYAVAGFTAASAPASITPAISVRNNVPSATQRLVVGNPTSPLVVENTDVLTVRGHFNSAPLFVASTNPANLTTTATGGTIVISSRSPAGLPQDLSELVNAVVTGRRDALLIVSGLSDLIYGVAQLNPGNSIVAGYDPDPAVVSQIVIAYDNRGGIYTAQYGLLSADGVFPDSAIVHPPWLPARDLVNVGTVALLEEYRFYVRQPNDLTETPRLSVARFYPGTQISHPAGGWITDLADSILDLQVALGFDSSFDGTSSSNGFFDFDADNVGTDDIIVDGDVRAGAATSLDDWLFNDAADTANLGSLPWLPTAASGNTPPSFSGPQPRPRLYYARVTTLSMAAKGDRGYYAPTIAAIEDHIYGMAPGDPVNGEDDRRRRRLLLTTIIDLRNL
ncbi:MAG: prepilin-type N-terminal cleavage/methylation domain-containing protein [Acidobacteria bacterium]|nr:prepilin-type N-terminal cleavage/methylation domain-containing protein [Acidobacteriota bacterium]